MNTIKDLRDLLSHYLRNLLSTEEQMLQFLPAIAEKAKHRSLKNALHHHLELTKEHKVRLEEISELLLVKGGVQTPHITQPSSGMRGLIEEANALLESEMAEDVTDAAIIGCVQAMEHYEIYAYGTAIAYAAQLKLRKVEELLKETLNEEYDVDDLLTALATASLNKEAVPDGIAGDETDKLSGEETNDDNLYTGSKGSHKSGSERTINSPGGRAGTSHRGYSSGESRGH